MAQCRDTHTPPFVVPPRRMASKKATTHPVPAGEGGVYLACDISVRSRDGKGSVVQIKLVPFGGTLRLFRSGHCGTNIKSGGLVDHCDFLFCKDEICCESTGCSQTYTHNEIASCINIGHLKAHVAQHARGTSSTKRGVRDRVG